jgi:hypothetical protein
MPKLQVVRQQDGTAAALMPDGSLQPISHDLMREVEIPLSQVRNEGGLGAMERIKFMNLANDPELGRGYLESIGYETRRLPAEAGAWNFAIRKSPKDPWRIVDPIGGLDMGDFLDLLGDLGVGAVSGVGAGIATGATAGSVVPGLGTVAGGLIGGAIGAGLGSAAGETARQAIGSQVIPNQGMDPGRIAMSGVEGAASVPIAEGLGLAAKGALKAGIGTARAAGRLGNEIAARMASVREAGGMSAGGVNMARMLEPEPVTKQLSSIASNAREFMRIIGRLDSSLSTLGPQETMMPEKVAEMGMLSEAAQGGGVVNANGAAQRLMSLIREVAEEDVTTTRRAIRETTSASEGKSLRVGGSTEPKTASHMDIDEVATAGSRAKGPKDATRVSSRSANFSTRTTDTATTTTERKMVEQPLSKAGALEAQKWPAGSKAAKGFFDYIQKHHLGEHPLTSIPVDIADGIAEKAEEIAAARGGRFGQLLNDFATGVRTEILDAMGGPQSQFGLNRAVLEARSKSLTAIKRAMGWGKPTADVQKQTVSLLKALDADSHAGFLAHVSDIEKQFGLQPDTLLSLVRRSALAESFGHQGAAELLGPITAMGGFRNAGVGGAVGFMAGGGLPGAAAGALIGMYAGSPITLARMTKAGMKVGKALTAVESRAAAMRLSPAAKAAGIAAIRASTGPIADAAVVREKPRKKVYIGQF